MARRSSARGGGAKRAARFASAATRVALALATLEGCGGLAADGPARGEPELGAPGGEDPISRVHHGFWDEIGLRQAAGELFVEPGVLRSELSRLPPALMALGMPSASVARSAFASAYVEALCILHATSEHRPSGC